MYLYPQAGLFCVLTLFLRLLSQCLRSTTQAPRAVVPNCVHTPSPSVLIAQALEPYSVSAVREGVEGLLAVIRIRVESPGVGGLWWGLPRA